MTVHDCSATVIQSPKKSLYVVWWILFSLLLTSSASTCLKHSPNHIQRLFSGSSHRLSFILFCCLRKQSFIILSRGRACRGRHEERRKETCARASTTEMHHVLFGAETPMSLSSVSVNDSCFLSSSSILFFFYTSSEVETSHCCRG